MPIGKYIYCTGKNNAGNTSHCRHKCLSASTFTVLRHIRQFKRRWRGVTNAYRQVHLLYGLNPSLYSGVRRSQMPIGKYIYCTLLTQILVAHILVSQMPIGKYIYCTHVAIQSRMAQRSQMPIGKYIYCTPNREEYLLLGCLVTNAYRQVHLLY